MFSFAVSLHEQKIYFQNINKDRLSETIDGLVTTYNLLYYSGMQLTMQTTPKASADRPLIVIESTANLDLGNKSHSFIFEYRPNPVITSIQPRKSILR